MERKKQIIILSCMHGRHKTVEYCINKMRFIDQVMIYSSDEDGVFLYDQPIFAFGQHQNQPLSHKWNAGIMALQDLEFDAVILLGSDDYIDDKFVQFVSYNIDHFDMIAFTDIYFESDGVKYYWSGYENNRQGEPIGAGKVYTKQFLKRIKYNLFNKSANRGLDHISWNRCKQANAHMLITSVREHGLMLCDVKDGHGMNDISSIENLIICSE